jgi:hypothetical protein
VPRHCRMRGFDRDLIRGGHYGQRPCAAQRATYRPISKTPEYKSLPIVLLPTTKNQGMSRPTTTSEAATARDETYGQSAARRSAVLASLFSSANEERDGALQGRRARR